MYLALLLVVPLLIAVGSKALFGRRVTWGEFGAQVAVVCLIVGGGAWIAYSQQVADTEIWSGRVQQKSRERVSCSHSYPCRCRMVSCGKNCSTMHCDTCYEHLYDVSWRVYTTNAEMVEIYRVDRQGLKMPPRWEKVFVGEPTALPHQYENYIKAAQGSIIRRSGAVARFSGELPNYPRVYDYYRADRFIPLGLSAQDVVAWNWLLAELNADLGARKQVNVIIVAVAESDPDYEFALEEYWLGGKKNDIIVILGTPKYPRIDWVRVVTWADAEAARVLIRDEVQDIGSADRRDDIVSCIRRNVLAHYRRRPMDDFKWLLASYQPGAAATIILFVLGVAASLGISWVAANNEIEQEY